MSQSDKRVLDVMESTAKITNGHYEKALTWKNYHPCLKNNKSLAENRLKPLKRILERNPGVLVKYKEVMEDLLRKGYARQVRSHDLSPLDSHWYLPHHPGFNRQKPRQDQSGVRLLRKVSWNLAERPASTGARSNQFTRWTSNQIPGGSSSLHVRRRSDVPLMRVQPSDCGASRFLWWPDGKLDQPPKEFQMTVHLFGRESSPSCVNFVLKKTAENNKEEFDPVTIETVQRNFYVKSEKEAIQLANQLREILAKGGFRLTKWVSNSREVINSLPESERAASAKDLDLEKLPVERALGVQ